MPRPKRNFALDRDPITALKATGEPEEIDDEEAEAEGLLAQEIDGGSPSKPRKVSVNDDTPSWWQCFYRSPIALRRDSAGRNRWWFNQKIFVEANLYETSEEESALLMDLRKSA